MAKCAIIIPVHEYNDTVKDYLMNAIESVVIPENSDVKIYVSCPKEISAVIGVDVPENVEIIESSNGSSFQTLVNNAVDNLEDIEWFSILEFDDTFSDFWIKEFNEYSKYYPETSVFMPLTDLIRENNGKKTFVGYGNEAPLASAFSNELGYIDFEVLESYFDFYLTGSFFNRQDFVTAGKLKESMKLTFWYEFLLRLTNKSKKVQVIPKVGYRHLVDRKNSLFSIYRDTMSEAENKWWQETAKEEYRYDNDRNKQYNKDEEEE